MGINRNDIERMLGRIDDHLASEIVATEAGPADLAKALAWLQADEIPADDSDCLPTGKVAELIGILETDDNESIAPNPPVQGDWAR